MENFEIKENDVVMDREATLVVEEDASMRPMIVTEDDRFTKNDIEVTAWKDPSSFLAYIKRAMATVPGYSDGGVNSLKRAIAYYDALLGEMEEAVAKDAEYVDFTETHLGQLDQIDRIIVEARNTLVGKLDQSGNNFNRQALVNKPLVKEAKSAPLTWVVDPFLKAIVMICINAKVQGGKDIEEIYQQLKKEYNMDAREDLAVLQILTDAGYPIRHSRMGGSEDMIEQYYA